MYYSMHGTWYCHIFGCAVVLADIWIKWQRNFHREEFGPTRDTDKIRNGM